MLGDEERILFRRLSVFADGWTFEAAEALCPDLDLLTLLTQLINKSLVSVEDKGEESRYFLLETVRQYARDKLLESGEVEQIRDLHLTYFHDLAQQAEPQLYRVEAMGWVIRLEAEHDNIRTAIEWGMEKNITAVLEICCALAMFWFRRGLEGESRTLMEQALARVDSLPKLEGQAALRQTDLIANTWLNLGFLSFSQGDAKRAIQATQRAAHMARQTGNNSILARALGFEFSSRMVMGESQELDAILDEGLAASRASDDLLANGMMLGMFGTRLLMTGRDLDAARTYAEQGLTLLKESGNRWGYTMVLLSVAIAAKYARRFEEARSNLAVCLPTFQEMGDMHRVNMIKSELAHMEREEGHWEKAEQIYRETVVEWQRLGHRAAVAHQLECLAFIAKIQEKGERAATILGAAEALREQIHIPMTAVEHTAYEREIAELRAGMDKSVFDFAWLRGRAMTMEAAIQTALED
jgi:non-specific serine/threonine protein kinase